MKYEKMKYRKSILILQIRMHKVDWLLGHSEYLIHLHFILLLSTF